MTERGQVNLHLILTIFLGFGMVLFGVLAVLAYRDNSTTQANFANAVSKARTDASTKQKDQDEIANVKANELPYRTYTADAVNGSFQLQIPKSWSLYAGKNSAGTDQLNLMADPGVVNDILETGALNSHTFRLRLQNRPVASVNKQFDTNLKQKKLTSKGIKVSGISGTWYEGVIDDQRHNGVAVTIPVRDKTLLITTDNRSYLDEFKKILDSAKINP